MTTAKLESKHYSIFEDRGIGNPSIKHSKLSLQFAIELLEELNTKMSFPNQVILDKIQELKTKLNGNN